ncbi:MAG TPA: ScpA family protein [Thermomicrobiales bacterium]|jgi:segregation and condensation protein A
MATRGAQLLPFAYACSVPGFEGPLDVLLRLIEREELDITEISLALVADQFVAYIAAQPDSDPALLAEFAAVASRLLLLKTRGLFPRASEVSSANSEIPPDEDDLVRQLIEYRQIKGAAGELALRDRAGLRAFAPLTVPAHATAGAVPEITLAPAGPFDLLRAVHRRLARQPVAPRVLNLIPRISVGEMAARVLERLLAWPRGDVRLSRLVRDAHTRPEVVTTFMAILELVRRRRVDALQAIPFGDIVVVIADDQPLSDQPLGGEPFVKGDQPTAGGTDEAAADD